MAQNRFRSTSTHMLDEKGRLNLPIRFREVLRQSGADLLMVVPWKDHLRAYRLPEWEALETKLLTEGAAHGVKKIARYALSLVVECPVDKQGRIRISPELRATAKLDKDIALRGMSDWFEIWDKDASQADFDEILENFDELSAGLDSLGIL